jgi:transmembrane sensor
MRGVLHFILPRRSAAAWFARLRAGPITPRLDTKYRRWLAADPANEVKYERHELAWELAGELAKDDEIAALLADAQRAAVETAAPRPGRRHLLMLAGAAASLAAIAIGANFYVRSLSDAYSYATAVGEQRSVVLPDQSRIVLNTSTKVHVVYKRGSRVVEIERGEATFSVAHDASRPFDVVAAHGTTRAIGTEFNILTAPTGVTVSVLSGTVAITPPSRPEQADSRYAVRLTRGEELTYSNELVSEVRPLNADRIQAWHVGRIAFEDLPLSQALAEFNRYTQKPIVIRDASLGQLRVTGIFRIGETDALLRALNTAFGIRANPDVAGIELEAGQADADRPDIAR